MSQGRIQSIQDALTFIKGGNAHVTFRNTESGRRYTYKVKKAESGESIFFVSVLCTYDNNLAGSYKYIGLIGRDERFNHTAKSKVKETDVRFRGFRRIYTDLVRRNLDPRIEVWHEGRCGRCGRLLTVPESIEAGFGPTCVHGVLFSNRELSQGKLKQRV